MDQPAQRTDEVPVPRAGQVLVRTLPATFMLTLGIPGLVLDWTRSATHEPSGCCSWVYLRVLHAAGRAG